MGTEPQSDRNAMTDNIQRTVERTALRKVRKLVDNLDAEESGKKRLERRALVIAAIVAVLIIGWVAVGAIQNDRQFTRDQPVAIPAQVEVPKKH
jgi:hypothetical protein